MAYYPYPYPSDTWPYKGLDYDVMPNLDAEKALQMKNDGIDFVGRYLYSAQNPNGKGISAAEAQIYLDAGIRIFLYYEVNTGDALGGWASGVANGRNAAALAAALTIPAGTPIICCCDTSVTDADAQEVVMAYLQGFASELPTYNVGIYGGANVVEAAYNLNPVYNNIQAGAWGAQEFSPIFVRQWYIPKNNDALVDGYITINGVTLNSSGYASYGGASVDLLSAPSIANMWGDPSPTPPGPGPGPTPTDRDKMPIWFYLRKF